MPKVLLLEVFCWDARDANIQHCPFPRPGAIPGSSSHWINAINVLITAINVVINAINVLINGHSSARAGAALGRAGWCSAVTT